MLTRTNSKGEIIEANNSECSAVPGEAAFVKLNLVEIYSSEAPVPTFQYTNFAIVPFKPLERTFEVASNLGCSVPSNCTTLKISGPGSICNQIETVLYKTVRNPGCVLPATWVYDTAMVRLITATDTTLSVQFKRAGSAKIVAKYSTGCGTLNDTISVHVAPMAGAFSLGQDTAICPGNTFLLKAGEGFLSYKWQDGSVDSNFTVTAPGLYHVNVTDLCGRSYADSVRVNQRPPVPFVVSEDRMKCNDDTLRFVAPSGFLNYTWSSSNDNVSIAGRDVVVNPPVNTVYYVKAEKTPGCYAYDTIRVAVNHSPAIDLGLDQSFCSGDSVTFDAGAGFSSYTWSTGDTLSKITVRALGPYRIKATTAQGCSSFDTVFVRDVWGLPDARLDKRAGLCTGEIRTLNPGNFQSYIWQDGSTAPTYKVSAPGRYFVQVKDLHGCKGYDSTNIKDVSSLPSNFLPLDTMLCSYSTLVIKPVSNYKSYLWNEGSRTEKVSIGQPGTYWLQVEDNNGCIGKDSITVHPKECISGVYVPNAFSPNKDRKNDLFSAQVFGHVAKFELIVYNRWGRVVFRTTNPTKGWDGRFSGIEQDSGTFIWMCRYRLESEPEKMVKGTVVLIR
jgi:gliding motility-associated-like protein